MKPVLRPVCGAAISIARACERDMRQASRKRTEIQVRGVDEAAENAADDDGSHGQDVLLVGDAGVHQEGTVEVLLLVLLVLGDLGVDDRLGPFAADGALLVRADAAGVRRARLGAVDPGDGRRVELLVSHGGLLCVTRPVLLCGLSVQRR